MSLYGALSASTLAMMSQSYALNVIGQNVANITTGGYKRSEVGFETILSESITNQSDLNGAKPNTFQRISAQGQLQGTQRDLDLAINGKGFFIVSPSLTDTSTQFYTRDGSFEVSVENAVPQAGAAAGTDEGYLIDKNGLYVLGFPAAADGTFASSGTPEPMRIDQNAFTSVFQTTTASQLDVNLPANNATLGNLPENAGPTIPVTTTAAQRHATAVNAFNNGTTTDGFEFYNVETVDSAGNLQNVRLHFTKDADNSWLVSASTTQTAVAQVDSVTLAGTPIPGDVFNVVVNGTTFTHTAGVGDTVDTARDALVTAINANATLGATAAPGATGVITLTAQTAGTGFSTTTSVTEFTQAQVDTLTIGGTPEAGDIFTATINGTVVAHTVSVAEAGGGINGIRTGVLASITGAGITGITAAAGAGAGEITLTGPTAGTPFTLTTATTDAGAVIPVADQTFISVNTTPSIVVDQTPTAAQATTTANAAANQTAAQDLDFTSVGGLTSTQPLTFTTTFAGTPATTSTFTLDFTGSTQFAGPFTPTLFTRDGFASATLTGVSFDSNGHVVGSFGDSTFRNLYKIPVATFSNPDGLMAMNGMTFSQSANSGSANITFVDTSSVASFAANTVELSNVDISDEFTKMIITQNAYNSNATVFKTIDEMTELARDLKR